MIALSVAFVLVRAFTSDVAIAAASVNRANEFLDYGGRFARCFESPPMPTPAASLRAHQGRATSLDIASFPNVSSAARESVRRRRRS